MKASHLFFLGSFLLLFGGFVPFTHAQTPTPPPPTCRITLTPTTISVGGSLTVVWRSTNATFGTITHIGSVAPNDEINLLLSSAAPTVFEGTFTGPGGTVNCSGTVSVSGSGSTGGGYSTGGSYSATPYTINPSNFTTNPNGSSYSQTPTGNSTPNLGGGKSTALVPCGNATDSTGATSCNICELAKLTQNMINFLLMLAIPIAAALFAWAGFLYFTAAVKPAQISQAHKIFSAVFIGFAIALSGYTIVQTLLNGLLNQSFQTGQVSLTSLSCDNAKRPRTNIIPEIFETLFTPTGSAARSGVTGTGATSQTGLITAGGIGQRQCSADNPNCSTDAIAAAAGAQNVQLTQGQINTMSCIATNESGGTAAICSGTGPCGTFQISQGNWTAYAPSSCQPTGGTSITSMQNNGVCNAQTAAIMVSRFGFGAWTGSWDIGGKNAACVQNYNH